MNRFTIVIVDGSNNTVSMSGWKIHLSFDPSNQNTISVVKRTLDDLQENGFIAGYKIGQGGGIDSGQFGKEATIYVGSFDAMLKAATQIDEKVGEVLLAPNVDLQNKLAEKLGSDLRVNSLVEIDIITDDLPIGNDRIWTRFHISSTDINYNQYGALGIPYLESDHKDMASQSLWGTPLSTVEKNQMIENSVKELSNKYGSFFHGLTLKDGTTALDFFRANRDSVVNGLDYQMSQEMTESVIRTANTKADAMANPERTRSTEQNNWWSNSR